MGKIAAPVRLVFLLLLVAASSDSCIYRSVRNRCISTAVKDRSITMFDRYELSISGCVDTGHDTCRFTFGVNFTEQLPASAEFDSIPIFVIDSICFAGECLGDDYYSTPVSGYDYHVKGVQEGREIYVEPSLPLDLRWISGEIQPDEFLVPDGVLIPESCGAFDVTVVVIARMYDRVSGDEVGRERKAIPLIIERGKRYLYR